MPVASIPSNGRGAREEAGREGRRMIIDTLNPRYRSVTA